MNLVRFLSPIVAVATVTPLATNVAVPSFDHVVVVIDENHSFSEIIGNKSAPYINYLAANGALFTNSHGITHPSQPNYLELFSGSAHGVTTNDSPKQKFQTPNLGSQLIAVGFTFKGYAEGLPTENFNGDNAGGPDGYWRKHCPWINFSDIPLENNRPFTDFPNDFNHLPTVSFVIPNQRNDMHNGSIAEGDTWLRTKIGEYAAWAKTNNSLLIFTFDEDDFTEGNRMPTIFFGANVVTGVYSGAINHHNVLRTLEDMYGLPYAGRAAAASPITAPWIARPISQAPSLLTAAGSPGRYPLRKRL